MLAICVLGSLRGLKGACPFSPLSGVALQFMGLIIERCQAAYVGWSALALGFIIQFGQIAVLQLSMETSVSDDDLITNSTIAVPPPPPLEECDVERSFDKWEQNLIPYFLFYIAFGVHATLFMLAKFPAQCTKTQRWFYDVYSFFPFVEGVYSILSVTSKIGIAVLVWTTVRSYLEHFAPCDARVDTSTHSEDVWDRLRITFGMVVPGITLLVLSGILAWLSRSYLKRKGASPFTNPLMARRHFQPLSNPAKLHMLHL